METEMEEASTPQQTLMRKLRDVQEKAAKGESAPDAMIGLMEELVNMTLNGERAEPTLTVTPQKPRKKSRMSLGLEESQTKYSEEVVRAWKVRLEPLTKVILTSL
jgi:hypothetical protein